MPKRLPFPPLLVLVAFLSFIPTGFAQSGHTLYGDFKVDESKVTGVKPITYDLVLYVHSQVLSRQSVSNGGRYRFTDLGDGFYELAVELEGAEIMRQRVELTSPRIHLDFRQDISLEWKPIGGGGSSRPASVSEEDFYKRSPVNQKRFEKAQEATDKKKYSESETLLNAILAEDPNDFQTWTEIGTVYLVQNKPADAEKAYLKATELRPAFFLALMNLGRLKILQKDYEAAIPVLTRAVEKKPTSAEANYYLGEAYLQIKKGSKAVIYFNEALKLDPVGKADAHLRLAALYNAAGLKDKAAVEYEAFLKKKPDYPERKKLEQYIAANKTQEKKP